MRNHEGPSFDKAIPVDSHDSDLVRKAIESESPLTTDDIDKHVDSIVQTLRSIKDRTNARLQIESLIQDEVMGLFIADLFKDAKVAKSFLFRENDYTFEGEVRNFFKLGYDVNLNKFLEENPNAAQEVLKKFQSKYFDKETLLRMVNNLVMVEKPEYRAAIERIQKAFIERLKARLVQEQDLADIQFSSIDLVSKFISPSRPHIQTAQSLENQNSIIRTDRLINTPELMEPQDIPSYESAVQKFLELPPNEHILPYEYYDFKEHKGRVKVLGGLGNLDEIVDGHNDENLSFIDILQVVQDCVSAAEFLEQNELVMQDIAPGNLGFLRDEKGKVRGILFDPEGLYALNAPRTSRLANLSNLTGRYDFLPPEVSSLDKPVAIKSSEMIFQFGVSLKFMRSYLNWQLDRIAGDDVHKYPKIQIVKSKLEKLLDDMTFFDRNNPGSEEQRPRFSQIKQELESMINEVRSYLPVKE